MSALLEVLSGAGARRLWLDYSAYAGRLLAGGKIPWLQVSDYVAWQRKAQGLLKSDVVAVPLAPLVATWVEAHTELREAMAAKRRATFPLKNLLADAELRAHLVELLAALRAGSGRLPLVLCLPSPRAWVRAAHAQAHGADEGLEVGGDEVDSAAVLVADFLRAFGESSVTALLLEERAGDEPDRAELAWYQPIVNIAAHYRWDLGLRLPEAARDIAGASGFGFVIAPKAIAGLCSGIATPAGFWKGAPAPACPDDGFRFAEIPGDANPEKVLESLGTLR